MEIVGAVASIIAIAELGVKTATTLGNFRAAAKAASRTVQIICSDINSVADILYQIYELKSTNIIRNGITVPVLTTKLIQNIETSSKSCKNAFERVEAALKDASQHFRHYGSSKTQELELSLWGKFHWPYSVLSSKILGLISMYRGPPCPWL